MIVIIRCQRQNSNSTMTQGIIVIIKNIIKLTHCLWRLKSAILLKYHILYIADTNCEITTAKANTYRFSIITDITKNEAKAKVVYISNFNIQNV